MQHKIGKIINDDNTPFEKHENDIAWIFTWLGLDVEQIRRSNTKGQKTADALIGGVEWEFKSPTGNSRRTLDNTLGRASKQSRNIIIDLRRIKRDDKWCIHEIRRLLQYHKDIKRLKIITKAKKIIDILPKMR